MRSKWDLEKADPQWMEYLRYDRFRKNREFNKETHLAFIDFEKAFDNPNRNLLWEAMIEKGYTKHLIKVTQSVYKDTNIKVGVKGKTTDTIVINKGVR